MIYILMAIRILDLLIRHSQVQVKRMSLDLMMHRAVGQTQSHLYTGLDPEIIGGFNSEKQMQDANQSSLPVKV